MNREEWVNKGFVDEPVDKSIDLKAAINELKKEKNAVILGHYYQKGEICESLKNDPIVERAEEILLDPKQYRAILQPAGKSSEEKSKKQ